MRPLPLVTLCAAAALSARLRAERPAFQAYSSANGLASDAVTALCADERGYLWIGTTDGLSRFDGERFVTFGAESGLPSARILALEVVQGRLFVATGGGLARLDESASGPRPFVPLSTPAGVELEVLRGGRDGRLWAGGVGGLVLFTNPGSAPGTRVPFAAPGPVSVRSIVEDPSGTTWVGTARGLVRLAPGRPAEWRPVAEQAGHDAIDALADVGGRLLIGHEASLYVLAEPRATDPLPDGPLGAHALPGVDAAGRTVLPARPGEVRRFDVPGHPVRHAHAGGGHLLFGTPDVVGELGERLVPLLAVHHLLGDNVSALESDSDGNTWIGTEGHGLLRLRRDGVTRFGVEDGLAEARIRAVVPLPGGALAVLGGGPDALSIGRGDSFRPARLKLPASDYHGWGWAQVLLRARTGDWWLATGTGLCRFPAGRAAWPEGPGHVYTRADGLGGDDVFRVFEDAAGDLWIGAFGPEPFTRRDARTGRLEAVRDPSLPRHAPTAFSEDRAGNLWVALYDHGLARRRRGRWDAFPVGSAAPGGFIHALLTAHDGTLWIASGREGLWRVPDPDAEHPAIERYARGEPLPSQNLRALAEDGSGRLWIGTTRGIARLDAASGRVRPFGPSQGLPNEIVTCAARDAAGQLWFGTLDGLVRLVPGADTALRPPAARLTAVVVDGVTRFASPLGTSRAPDLELPVRPGRLAVEFTAPSLAPESAVRYETRLAGAEAGFGPPSDSRRVELAALAAGSYRLEVRALRGGVAGPVASVGFVVPPPLWRRPWVAAAALLAAAALAYSAHRVRVAHLLALEHVRTGIASDLHDDLGAGLSRIGLLSEVAELAFGVDDPGRDVVAKIGAAARELDERLADGIWTVDPAHDDLASLGHRLCLLAGELLEPAGITWRVTVPEDAAAWRLPPDRRRELYLLLKEAAANAARHSGARHFHLAIERRGAALAVTVEDDGRGFETAGAKETRLVGGHGLANMRARAAALGGTLRVESAPGRGTRLVLEVPGRP